MSVSVIDATSTGSTGTVMVSGNMPAFAAYSTSAQSFSSSTQTKIQFNAKTFDTASAFDATTNYRFTPQVAGYYQITLQISLSAATGYFQAEIYKNGAITQTTQTAFNASSYMTSLITTLLYMNGSTDYVEGYCYQNNGSSLSILANRPDLNYFSGALVRAA